MKMNLIFITFLLVFGDLFASEQTNITCKASALEEVGAKTHLHELKIISNSDLLSKVNNRLKEIELNSEYDYINTLERIANYLVETGQISEKDSRVVFAEKIFSDYDQIFFKFALAELYSRDFQKEDIENLLQSYNGLTNRQTQIEFAVSVAERMLLLVNDSPGMRSSAGIRQFKEMAEALGVSELTYKSFLGMWRYLISSKTELVLEYTLIQLRSLSENIVIENQRLEIEANDLRANLPAWKKIFGGADNISLPKSKFEIDLDIDQRLLVIGPFDFKNKSKYSFLSRYTGKKVKINQLKGLKELFDTVSLLVIDHVIINSIDQISYPVLLEFVETKEFESLSPSTQDKIRTKIHEYDHFKDLVTNLIKKQNEIEEGLKEIAEKKFDVNTLYKKHLKEFEEQLMVDIDSNSTANLAAKNLRRGLQNILTEVNIKENQSLFYDILVYVLHEALNARKLATSIQVLEYLSMESKQYHFSKDQKDQIIHAVEIARYNSFPNRFITGTPMLKDTSSGQIYLKRSVWGGTGVKVESSVSETRSYPKNLKSELNEIQKFLLDKGDNISKTQIWKELVDLVDSAEN